MPATRIRTRVIARNFISSSGLNREVYIPWQNVYLAAASITGMAASLQIVQVGGSQSALRFATASPACPVWVQSLVPQDIAISGPAAGSGTVWMDWTDLNTSGCAVVGASLFLVPTGSAIGDAGTSTLGAVAATQFAANGTASELSNTSLFQFTVPSIRTGQFALRFTYDGGNASSVTASNFALFSLRIRYLADRIGT